MPLDAVQLSPGAILVCAAARTAIAVRLSVGSHGREEAGPSPALQWLSDGILATGAVLYANAALRPDAPRHLMAALLVYAITWEGYVGMSRVEAFEYSADQTLDPAFFADNVIAVVRGWGWMFMTAMLVAFGAAVVMSRPELTDSQKFAPFAGCGVPLAVGLALRAYVSARKREGWGLPDSAIVVITGAALAFACWAWL